MSPASFRRDEMLIEFVRDVTCQANLETLQCLKETAKARVLIDFKSF